MMGQNSVDFATMASSRQPDYYPRWSGETLWEPSRLSKARTRHPERRPADPVCIDSGIAYTLGGA